MNKELFLLNESAALALPFLLLAFSTLLGGKLTRKVLLFGQISTFVFATAGLIFAMLCSPFDPVVVGQSWFTLQLDRASSALIAAITMIAAIVTMFSERYLGGEKSRDKFLAGLSLLSSCSALLVVSNNLFLAFALWHLLSWGLWSIMRLQGQVAATKSASLVLNHHLLSDIALFAAILVVYSSTGNYSFSKLPEVLPLMNSSVNFFGLIFPVTPSALASLLLVFSFSVKSALFPFHRWLLATLEAPTPLSGLLHAGIVNVSAILAWRTMPILQENPGVLVAWALLSAISALVGTLSMSAQPDVKRKLVYSTIGQMGFMSLQCASGAIGAALFHLIAHGMFKCHLFLQSGSAVAEGLNKRKFDYADNPAVSPDKKKMATMALTALACSLAVYILCSETGWTTISAIVTASALAAGLPALNRVDVKSACLLWSAILLIVLGSAITNSRFESLFHLSSSPTGAIFPVCLGIFALIAVSIKIAQKSQFAKALYVYSLSGFYAEEMALAAKTFSLRRTNETH